MLQRQVESLIIEQAEQRFNTDAELNFMADFSTRMSHVFQYQLVHGGTPDIIYVKSDKAQKGLLNREYKNLCLFKEVEGHSHFKVPKILSYFDENETMALFECEGELIRKLMVRNCKRSLRKENGLVSSAVNRMGAWLNYYQGKTSKQVPWSEASKTILQECNEYEASLLADEVHPAIWQAFSSIKTRLTQAIAQATGNATVALSHGDCHLGNFYVTDDDITALDFQHSKVRLAGYDAMYFDATLKLSFGITKYRPANIAKIREAFFQGYDGEFNCDSLQTQILKMNVALRVLVYLQTVSESLSFGLGFLTRVDLTKLINWLNE